MNLPKRIDISKSSFQPGYSVRIVADESIEIIDRGQVAPPADWESRAIYCGERGARNWLAVVGESTYPLRDPEHLHLRKNRLAAVRGRLVHTVVSLGPGDGLADVELLIGLSSDLRNCRIRYIPVDLSRLLLETAIAGVMPVADIPVGILCDFEVGHDFLSSVLAQHTTEPNLFVLLGGTLGNLDRGESSFVAGLKRLMKSGDLFLVDVPLAAPGWTATDEPRLKSENYTPLFRRFLAEGLLGHASWFGREVPRNDIEIESVFESRIGFVLTHDTETGAEVITVKDYNGGRSLLRFRRYRWRSILRWFEAHGLAVEFARSSVTTENDKFGMGVVLLRFS